MNLLSKAEMKNVMGGVYDNGGGSTGCPGGQTASECIMINTMNINTDNADAAAIMMSIITSECNRSCSGTRPQ